MKVIIHIGTHKTGTSTIQHFLGKNRNALKHRGVFVPQSSREDYAMHHDLFAATCIPNELELPTFMVDHLCASTFKMKEYTTEDQDKYWEHYRHEIEANCHRADLVIFSNEHFVCVSENEIMRLKKLLEPLFDDISIVLYLRRQPEYLISHYSTFSTCGSTMEFFDYLNLHEECSFLAYHKIVERWSSILGKDKLKIRIFDKQEFYDNNLLLDFAHTVGFDMDGLAHVENANVSQMDAAETEFMRLLNFHIPATLDRWTFNQDRLHYLFPHLLTTKNQKSYHLTRSEAQHILDICREGNDWIAREYFEREKLFNEDVSMYPDEVASPHGLIFERCAEITANLWKERCQSIHHIEQENQGIQRENQGLHQEYQKLVSEKEALADEIQRQEQKNQRLTSEKEALADEIQRLLHRRNKRLLYRFKRLLTWIKNVFKGSDDGNCASDSNTQQNLNAPGSPKPKPMAKIWREIYKPLRKKTNAIPDNHVLERFHFVEREISTIDERIASIEGVVASIDRRISTFETFHKIAVLMQLSKLTGESILRVEGIIDEYRHWEGVLDGTYKEHHDQFIHRLQIDAEVQEPHLGILEELNRSFAIEEIAILDVGAGPVTSINNLYKGVRLNITAIDALGYYYYYLLKKHGMEPPVRTQSYDGEVIARHFPKESFHWIYARNSLDHMESPVECIQGMLPLLKPGGMISLFHFPNIGSLCNYCGFHQWDFFLKDNDFCIAGRNGTNHTNVTKLLLPDYATDTSLTRWKDPEKKQKEPDERPCLKVIIKRN